MNYGQIITEITRLIYGSTTPPDFVGTHLHGAEGLLARKRKLIMDSNYWFMEATRRFPLVDGVRSYALNINFKEEIDNGVRFEDYATGDYHDPVTKMTARELNSSFTDRDGEEDYPTHYYIDYNDDLDLRQFNFYKRPKDTAYSTVLSVGTTAERIANTAFTYHIGGTAYSGAVSAAGSQFSAANTINSGAVAGTFWGAWLIEMDSSGNVTTSPAGGLSDQVYASEAAALSNLPAPTYHPMGYVAIECNTGASWTANTDDLTEASDCTSCNFYNTSVVASYRISDISAIHFHINKSLHSIEISSSVASNVASVLERSLRYVQYLNSAITEVL